MSKGLIKCECRECGYTFYEITFETNGVKTNGANCPECNSRLVYPIGGIVDTNLLRKIDALGLAPIDSKIYNEHLEHMKNIGVGVRHFKYYKLYGQAFMPYSQEYLLGNSIEHLLKRDKENYRQYCPSLFGRLKRRIDKWLLRRELRKMGKKVR